MADIRLNSSVLRKESLGLPPAAADHGFVRVPKNDPYQLNNIAERSPDLIRQFTQELQKMLRCMVENINP